MLNVSRNIETTDTAPDTRSNIDLPDSLMPFCAAPHDFLLKTGLAGADARFRMNDEIFLVLSDPTSIHAVLNGKPADFEKGAIVEVPRISWRDGIITAEGQDWVEQHAIFAPAFARRRVRQLEPLIAALVTRQVEAWAALPAGEPVDILLAANRLAFDVVAKGLLGVADGALADALFDTLGILDRTETLRLNYLAKRFAGGGQRIAGRSVHTDALERMDRLAEAVADERLSRTTQPDDLIGAVMATAEFRAYAPARQRTFLADQVTTLLAAGYVTTGESIFWGLYLLARHPAAQARARAGILAETGAGRGVVPIDAPPFLAAAFNESQRLYPPVWFMGRVARRDIRIGEIDIAAGTRVICSPYVLHRNPAVWPDSDQYRPERFLAGAIPPVAPRALIPFGTGMRMCLGRGLALMEMSAIGCMTLARFELALVDDAPIVLPATFSMHPRDPVLFRLTPRG